MVDQLSRYEGKPTAYLDQNILDLFVKYGIIDFAETLKSKFQVVYSDETLKEIKRSGEYANKFLNVLIEIEAAHLKIVLEADFSITDNATITKRNPFDAYKEYCENEPVYDQVQKAMEQYLFKFSGGRTGDGISEINNEHKLAFSELLSHLQDQAVELSKEFPGIEVLIAKQSDLMMNQFEESLNETERQLKTNIKDDKNWSGVKDFRSVVGVGPVHLNNIQPPYVLKKIWELFQKVPPYNEMNQTIDKFFGLAINPIYPEKPYFKHQKVTSIYNILNTLGYHPDSKVHKERRFVAALSDQSHASIASFSDFLFSRDKKFIKKVRAAYEYLGIPTQVQHVVVNYA